MKKGIWACLLLACLCTACGSCRERDDLGDKVEDAADDVADAIEDAADEVEDEID